MNLAAMERAIAHQTDLDAIPHMSHKARLQMLADYQAAVDSLAAEESQALDDVRQYERPPDISTMRALRAVLRKHQGAKNALARIEGAIAKAEQVQAYPVVYCLPITKGRLS